MTMTTDTPRPNAPASELLAYLAGSGTPRLTIERCQAWMTTETAPTASSLCAFLERAGVTAGTILKACAWTFGRGYEPASLKPDDPKDELTALTQRLASLRDQERRLRGEEDALKTENARLRALEAKLERQLAAAK